MLERKVRDNRAGFFQALTNLKSLSFSDQQKEVPSAAGA
jgi:hypothetical protein